MDQSTPPWCSNTGISQGAWADASGATPSETVTITAMQRPVRALRPTFRLQQERAGSVGLFRGGRKRKRKPLGIRGSALFGYSLERETGLEPATFSLGS